MSDRREGFSGHTPCLHVQGDLGRPLSPGRPFSVFASPKNVAPARTAAVQEAFGRLIGGGDRSGGSPSMSVRAAPLPSGGGPFSRFLTLGEVASTRTTAVREAFGSLTGGGDPSGLLSRTWAAPGERGGPLFYSAVVSRGRQRVRRGRLPSDNPGLWSVRGVGQAEQPDGRLDSGGARAWRWPGGKGVG
jgi:hypothetical protein